MRTSLVLLAIAMVLCTVTPALSAGLDVVDAYYRPDVPFPQFDVYWAHKPNAADTKANDRLAGIVMVYVRNTTDQPVTVDDVTLGGISLSQAIVFDKSRKMRHYIYPANMHYSKLPIEQLNKLRGMGDPIWWRFDPKTLKPGEFGELVIRMRHKPPMAAALGVVAKGVDDLSVSVPITADVPKFEAICFVPGTTDLYVYTSHPSKGVAPTKIAMDGIDITGNTKILSDPASKVSPLVCTLSQPPVLGSPHYFQAVFSDGRKASALVRVFEDFFAYGMWGSRKADGPDDELAKYHLNDLALHNFNVQMEMLGSQASRDFMVTDEGQKMLNSLGIRCEIAEVEKWGVKNPWAFFIADEPDAGDTHTKNIPTVDQLGTLANGVVLKGQELHDAHPIAPGLVNVDYTFTPHNYYVYGQSADILGSDPYYQARLRQEYSQVKSVDKITKFKKATYLEGVTAICQSSQAPKPVHITLLAGGGSDGGAKYAPAKIKRIEAYYCIGSGAKGLSYWWFYLLDKGLKPNTVDPAAQAQWDEMGLIGAELRTAGSVITTSCPASVPVTAPSKLWVRSLLHGNDTIVLVCVNDDYTCDLKGINIKPMKGVEVGVELPKWLEPKSVFEVSYKGTDKIVFLRSAAIGATSGTLKLGDVDVTKLIVITSDTTLKDRLQKVYEDNFAANVAKLLSQ